MSNAFDEVDFDYATTIADRANRFMSSHAVPPTPENFSVWYNYAMGASPALRKTVDILVANKRKFDSATNRDLYVPSLTPRADSGVADDFPEQLQGVISGAKEFLATAISDNRTHIETLGEVSSQCRVSSDPRPIIERLVK